MTDADFDSWHGHPNQRTSARRLRVTFLDVAQGDATLIRFPDGRVWLVDAGGALGRFDIGTRIVSPALWALGLRRLSTLVLTHGDRDHIGGAHAMLRDFRPGEVWEGVPVDGHVEMTRLKHEATGRRVRWRVVRSGDGVPDADDVDIRVWHPSAPKWSRTRVRNDDSIVLELALMNVSMVLPGDIGPAVERSLAGQDFATPALSVSTPPVPTLPSPTLPAPVLPVAASARAPAVRSATYSPTVLRQRASVSMPLRVLKVPHHGSRASSTAAFLDALQPSVAIVSAGRGNRHGHPAPAALARYAARGAQVFRTDRDGAIQLDTDGHTLSVRTCSGRRLTLDAGG